MRMNKQINEQTSILAVTKGALTPKEFKQLRCLSLKIPRILKGSGGSVIYLSPWVNRVSKVSEDMCPPKTLRLRLLQRSTIVQTFCWLLRKISKVRLVLQRNSKQFCGMVFVEVLFKFQNLTIVWITNNCFSSDHTSLFKILRLLYTIALNDIQKKLNIPPHQNFLSVLDRTHTGRTSLWRGWRRMAWMVGWKSARLPLIQIFADLVPPWNVPLH